MPDISSYTDYRSFLSDYYEEMKSRNKNFSYQFFAQKAGIKSKGFLYNVIKGKRNLSKSNIFGFIQAMKLSKEAANYFECLVSFNQAQDDRERNYFYEKLISIKSAGKNDCNPQIVRKDQYEFYSKMYHSAIRSLIDMYDVYENDYDWLAKNIYPPITAQQAKKSVQLLEKLGFIEKKPGKPYSLTNRSIATPKEVQDVVFLNYHREAGRIALDAMVETPKNKRFISGVTLGISPKTYETICEEISAFRRKIVNIVENDTHSNRVYQLNLQLFPLSNTEIKD